MFLWLTGAQRGIRAVMRAEQPPGLMHELEPQQAYWPERDTAERFRVIGRLKHRDVNLAHTELRKIAGLEDLPVFSGDQRLRPSRARSSCAWLWEQGSAEPVAAAVSRRLVGVHGFKAARGGRASEQGCWQHSSGERKHVSISFCHPHGHVLAAAASRLIPRPPRFTPIGAMGLGGARFADRRAAFLEPLAAMFLSELAIDLLSGHLSLGLHRLIPVVYGSFALIVCIGFWVRRRRKRMPIAAATMANSVLFFVLTNFGVGTRGSSYLKTCKR